MTDKTYNPDEQQQNKTTRAASEPQACYAAEPAERIIHLTLSHQYSPIAYSMGADNHCHDLTIENVKATHCEVTLPLNRQDCPRMWDSVTLRNVSITGHQ